MPTLTVYDPPMCCASGVCGPDVDPRLVQFASDLDWLKSQGVDVRRFNLAREAEHFVAHPGVKAILERSGSEALPVIAVGETVASSGRYPARQELAAIAGIAAAPADGEPLATSKEPRAGCCSGRSTCC